MTQALAKGTPVHWRWGRSTAQGKVEQAFTKPVSRTIKGARIRRRASADKPAYLIIQQDGDSVLKSHGEIETG